MNAERIKPAPKEVWVNEYKDGNLGVSYHSRSDAEKAALPSAIKVAVRYREVLED